MKLRIIALLLLVACAAPQMEVVKVEEALAVLAVHSGEVLVNGIAASAGQELKEGDLVRTMAGKASVVFFDSSVLRLDENTEVSIKKISKDSVELKQAAGQTWSRILKVSGIREYKIETPNTVATVRGTGFAVKVEDGDTKIVVKEGKVLAVSYKEDKPVAEALIIEDMELEISDETPAELELEAVQEDEWIGENVAEDEEFIDEVVADYMEGHPEIMEEMSDELTAEQIEEKLEEYVIGETGEPVKSDEALVEESYVEETKPEVMETPIEQEIVDEKPAEENTTEEKPIEEPVNRTEPAKEETPPEETIEPLPHETAQSDSPPEINI